MAIATSSAASSLVSKNTKQIWSQKPSRRTWHLYEPTIGTKAALVSHLRSAVVSGAGSNWNQASVQQIFTCLDALHQHLGRHFAREEEGGYLEEALVHAPRFQARASELMAEHSLLLERFGSLVATARGAVGKPAVWPGIAKDLNEAIEELVRHELEENRLLQESFAANLDLDQ